ncbi:MAG: hypothetical protein KH214_03140 [Ruminococcus sp.]|nr:hypothetical protein [Ruminococcus sp.]
MKLFLKKLYKTMYLWAIGGLLYCLFELFFRGHTHWTMFAVGGFCFVMCGLLNEHIGWDMPFPLQMLIGCLIITGTELIAGIVLNMWLGLNIWDYSNMPLNLWGQICLPFSCLWFFLSGVAIVLDDELRYNMFGEEKPHYYFWRKK